LKSRKSRGQDLRYKGDVSPAGISSGYGRIVGMKYSAPKYLVGSSGRREGVVLGLQDYQRLLRRIEDLEDSLALDRAEETSKQLLPYTAVRRRLKRAGKLWNTACWLMRAPHAI
jgi:hypothetical protein